MKLTELSVGLVAVAGLAGGCWAQEKQDENTSSLRLSSPRLVSTYVTKAPELDGHGNDEVWRSAIPLQVPCPRVRPNRGLPLWVAMRTVHTDTHIYILATWKDTTQSITHKTWTWSADKKAYEQGDDREDMFSLAFEHTGTFNADMLSGIESVWDVWHWKACRTNPQGHATDKTHHYTLTKPTGKAKRYTARTGKKVWITRPEDAGTSVEKKLVAPATFKGQRVEQYAPGAPTGSAADVRAKGVWADGHWTLELSRRLRTNHPDDTTFDPTRSLRVAIAPFDHTGRMVTASGEVVLTFARAAIRDGFEAETVGVVPGAFTKDLTGKGAPSQWVVRKEDGAPSGRKVVAQTSDDRTSYRFPLLVHDKLVARDVDVSVQFKAIRGKVDQAAGIVWRYLDRDNYYIVRANAIEDNVVLYKVEKGKRSNLEVKGVHASYGVKAKVPSAAWNTLRVVVVGTLFQVYLNDRHLFEVEDATFSNPGKVGIWTKADSVTCFDDFVALPLDQPKTQKTRDKGR